MPTVEDLQVIKKYYMLDEIYTFKELKPYLYSEFNLDLNKNYEFLVRGLPISDTSSINELFQAYMPNESLTIREI